MEIYCDEIDEDVMILAADGGLNAQTADELVEQLERLVDGGLSKLIIDCSKLDYISSYGIGVLLRLHQRLARQGGDVKVCAMKGIVSQVLQVSRLGSIFELYPDVGRARLAFR